MCDEGCCLNCNGTEFFDDTCRGETTCRLCGLVRDSFVLSDAQPFKDNWYLDWTAPDTSRPKITLPNGLPNLAYATATSAPYQQLTYVNERIGQWRQQEPKIAFKDLERILAEFDRQHPGGFPAIGKEDIRRLLAGVDAARVAAGKKQRFIRKYNEKWLTLRYLLGGRKSRGTYASERVVREVRSLLVHVLSAFKARVKGKGRYSIININFLFRRVFDLLGISWFAIDFPPLKTEAKRIKLVQMWVDCCDFLNWPYINNDQVTFPDVKFYQPVSWSSVYVNGSDDRPISKRRKIDTEKRFNQFAEQWIQHYY